MLYQKKIEHNISHALHHDLSHVQQRWKERRLWACSGEIGCAVLRAGEGRCMRRAGENWVRTLGKKKRAGAGHWENTVAVAGAVISLKMTKGKAPFGRQKLFLGGGE